ncbi:MAG: M48 family metalloprotease [Oscillospiraceae bacterium]|jgi:heat shock protein HtpX|nr:M48 family metalloprotease [Oscillospiraceae bacterium]
MLKNLNNIINNHYLSFICSLIYFLLGGTLLALLIGKPVGFLIAFILYIISVILAVSPTAEELYRFLHNIRKIETNEERDYLIPILTDVIETMSQEKPEDKKKLEKIEIFIIDKLDINAYALGSATIAITKGAIKAFDEDQLKGVLAHEIAHIRNFDTIANMFVFIASGFFYLFVLLFQFIISLTEKTTSDEKKESVGTYLSAFIKGIFKIFLFIFSFLIQITLAIERRSKEYIADETAYELGFGDELISALYLLEKISLGDYKDLKQRLTASHPRTTARIGRLESMGSMNYNFDLLKD